MPTELVENPALTTLASQINEAHARVEDTANNAVQLAAGVGKLLIRAKSMCDHGGWREWVEGHCQFAHRTATMYMRIAEHLPLLPADQQVVAGEGLRRFMRALPKPEEKVTKGTKGKAAAAPATPPPSATDDSDAAAAEPERPVLTPAVVAALEDPRWRDLQKRFRTLRRDVEALLGDPVGRGMKLKRRTKEPKLEADFEVGLNTVAVWLKTAAPYADCPLCAQKGCKRCGDTGWITRREADGLPKGVVAKCLALGKRSPK
jgi:hypothetical protein